MPDPKTKKRGIVFNKADAFTDLPIEVPCGQCVGCRLERSRQWGLRIKFEAQMHKENSFLTLTYNNEFLPEDLSLNLRHHQLFMKRVRKKFGTGIRYFMCGEYGEGKGSRILNPHFHYILFGKDFADKKHWQQNEQGDWLYTSETLDNLWSDGKGNNMGFTSIGDVNFFTAAYVARYCLKKVTGDRAAEHYKKPVVHPVTGEICDTPRRPEFAAMSKRPAIGHEWLKKYRGDVYPKDFITHDGVKMRPPAAFDKALEKVDPKLFRKMKAERKRSAAKHKADNNDSRLAVKEAVRATRIAQLRREI